VARQYYTLPTLRYTNFVRALTMVDGVVSVVLWLTGGNSDYFVDNILHFHYKQSVFDLALMASVKVILTFLIYWKLEEQTVKLIDHPYEVTRRRNVRLLHTAALLAAIVFLAYCVTKGGIILNSFLNDPAFVPLHPTYYGLVISAPCFSLVELVVALLSFVAMRRLKLQRILHRFNDEGQELDEEGKPKKKSASIMRLVKLAKSECGLIGFGVIGLLVSSGAQMVAPLFFGKVVDAAQKSMADLNMTVLTLLGIYIGGAIGSMFRSWLFTLAGHRFVARLRKNLYNNIIRQDIAFFDTNRTGELTNRLSSDTQVVSNAVTVNISMLVRNLLQIFGSLLLMFILNPALTGVLLAVVPVVAIGAVQYGMYVKKLRKTFQDRLADAGVIAEESFSSVRTVRTFSAENKSMASYGVDIDKSYQEGKKLSLIQGMFDGTIGILSYGAIALVLWYGGKLVNEGHLSPGILTAFLLYTLQVALGFAILSSLYGDFMQAVGASMRIFDLLDLKADIPLDTGMTLPSLQGDTGFYSVKFTYPSRPETPVLKGVSFEIERGQMVALVGPSGGGKSTIVSLLERFYDPESGTITLGGADLKALDPHWFRKQISMVSQEPTLFGCSIRDNIAYGRDEATDEEVMEVAKRANAHDFIMSFEDGYKTMVGERGVRLSGGQKQRVAIARALLMDPVLLLLDEATSALDAESEHLVQEAIDRAMKGRTVLVIAHRLSTVRDASQVIVIDKGEIAEKGTHEELVQKDGVYKKLVLRQLMAGSIQTDRSTDGSPQVTDTDATDTEGKVNEFSNVVLD
ncbi:uncharacterized protein LOC135477020, partial [Liolophura sinensis]|uniref:uncharacterized protein LOC135477020 n=1 Tax=Liolophura sinensis TaxID=3198878 RepID=UPI00315830C3